MAAAMRRFSPNAAVKNMAWKGVREFMAAMAKECRVLIFVLGQPVTNLLRVAHKRGVELEGDVILARKCAQTSSGWCLCK